MNAVIEKNSCCGCGACYSVCPKDAIRMQLDGEGFEYPFVNQDACIKCGLCKKVCPILQYEKKNEKRISNCTVQEGLVARNRNYEQRLSSSSGSIFPPIAENILAQGGIVVGAAFDGEFNVCHRIVERAEDLPLLQGSKYLQLKADKETFRYIKRELMGGRKVLYSGMACQVEGIKSFLQRDFENFYTIDLICMGIPSYVVWQKYLKVFFPEEKIKSVNFKEKSVGWDSFVFRVETEKRVFQERGMHNLYLQSMFRSWNMRPSCFQCPFKKIQRISDFTISDAWGVYKQTPQINDNKGLSSVIIHSSKGLELWNSVRDRFDQAPVSIDDIAKGNSNLVSNKHQSGNRKRFFRMLEKNPRKAFGKLCSVNKKSLVGRIWGRIKRLLCL